MGRNNFENLLVGIYLPVALHICFITVLFRSDHNFVKTTLVEDAF